MRVGETGRLTLRQPPFILRCARKPRTGNHGMKRLNPCGGTILLEVSLCLLGSLGNAFIFPAATVSSKNGAVGHLKMSWSADERVEMLRNLVEWQEKDKEIEAAGIKILTETSAPGGR